MGRPLTQVQFAFRMMGIRLSSAIRLHYLQSLFGQTIHVLDSMPSGAAASTITATANVLQLGTSEKLGVFLEFIVTIIASIVIAFSYNWELTLVTSSVILFIFCVLGVLLPFILKGNGRMTKVLTPSGWLLAKLKVARLRQRPTPLPAKPLAAFG